MDQPPPMFLTRDAAHALDHAALEEYHIPSILLMEHAALALLAKTNDMLSTHNLDSVLILCGPGNNGGDGYALARLLASTRINVTIASSTPPRPGTDAATNAEIATALAIPRVSLDPADLAPLLSHSTLIIDALFGTGLDRPLDSPFEVLFAAIHDSSNPILAVDLPSGLDADTGNPLGPCLCAEATLTFVAPKLAMSNPLAAPYLGRIIVANIGTPPSLLEKFGRPVEF